MRRSSSQTTLAQTRNVERLVALHAVGADQKDKLSQSRVARAVAQSLAFHRFAATNEATVEAQLDRIALKWELFGRADKAKALRMLAAHALANPVDELSLNRNAMHQAIAFLLFMENSAVMSPSSNPSPKMQLRNTSSASSKSASPKPASQSRFLEWKKANAPTSSQSAAKKRADAEDETTRESLAFAESLALRRRDASATGEYARTEWKAILDAEPLEGDHWDPVNYFSDDDETFSCEEDEEKIVHEDAHERSRGSRSGSQGPKSQDAESFSGRIGQLKGSMGPLDTAGDQTVVEDDAFLADYPVEKESQSPEMTELLNTHYWTPGRQIHGTDVSDFQFDMNEPNTLGMTPCQRKCCIITDP
ncbi:hypothetical protein BC830DRAFT_5799 [Chytriomyces sp. MP71]|nr:hypothetical protein BC830DRAFT_5799 [Chytriomyces sp. MP71]